MVIEYLMVVNAPEQIMPFWKERIKEQLIKEELSDRVAVLPAPFNHIDYGVNPLADKDLRPYIHVITSRGENLFDNVFGAGRISMQEARIMPYLDYVFSVIKGHEHPN